MFYTISADARLMLTTLLILAILAVCYIIYVSLIQKRNKVQEAFSSIDIQLKKRYDLIPNILDIANKFMEHERGLLENITNLRTEVLRAANVETKFKLDNEVQGLMKQLMVSVENYPQLKSDQTMVQAMQTYTEVEEHVAAARRFYNSAARELKNAVDIFPSSVIAGIMGIKAAPFFEVANETERQPVNASERFYK
jgi:LemA protein